MNRSMHVDDFVSFAQNDADEYRLELFADDGPDPNGHLDLYLSTSQAVELFEAMEKTIGEHVATMRREKAAYDRATPEERAKVLGFKCEDPESDWVSDMAHAALLDQQDMIRDRMRQK